MIINITTDIIMRDAEHPMEDVWGGTKFIPRAPKIV
jgi:hypothetical protein